MERRLAVIAAAVGAALCTALASASAPPGRYNTSITDTVWDETTDLHWQRYVDARRYDKQADAMSYCANLVLGGSSDWRLPTRAELLSIADRSRANPAIDATAFPSTPPQGFWTSSPYVGSAGVAWLVFFRSGATGNSEGEPSEPPDAFLVRCVYG